MTDVIDAKNLDYKKIDAIVREVRQRLSSHQGDKLQYLRENIGTIIATEGSVESGNPEELLLFRNILLKEIGKIEEELAGDSKREEDGGPEAENSEDEVTEGDLDEPKKNLFEEIIEEQQRAQELSKRINIKDGVQHYDENGQAVDGDEKENEGCITHVKEMDYDVMDYASSIQSIYDKFAELGFSVIKTAMGTDSEGEDNDRDQESSGYFFAIEMPKGYEGNKDILTMTTEQIKGALSALSATVEREVVANVIGSAPIEELCEFYLEQKEKFVQSLSLENIPGLDEIQNSLSGLVDFDDEVEGEYSHGIEGKEINNNRSAEDGRGA